MAEHAEASGTLFFALSRAQDEHVRKVRGTVAAGGDRPMKTQARSRGHAFAPDFRDAVDPKPGVALCDEMRNGRDELQVGISGCPLPFVHSPIKRKTPVKTRGPDELVLHETRGFGDGPMAALVAGFSSN